MTRAGERDERALGAAPRSAASRAFDQRLLAALGQSALPAMAKALCRAYAHIVLSRSPLVGLLLMGATLVSPRAFVLGIIAASAANGISLLAGLDRGGVDDGTHGYNAVLVGLGVSTCFTADAPAVAAALIGAGASVVVSASLRALVGVVAAPVLSLPFVIAFQLVSGASSFAGLARAPAAAETSFLPWLPAPVALLLKSLGGLLFLPRADAGLVVLAALLLHSRIATSLALTAFMAVTAMVGLGLSVPLDLLGGMLANAMLTAAALGGGFLVPSSSSFAFGLTASLGAALLTLGLSPLLARMGLTPLILPFNLTVIAALLTLRGRIDNDAPKAVDFIPGTPEENLAYDRDRAARATSRYAVDIHLPFRGEWTCTQGVDGAFTHQGPYRHAFDFEVQDREGRFGSPDAARPEEYHCYKLPVLAAAAGTVVSVQSAVPDSPLGGVNLDQNWGNYVVVYHAPGLYSLVAHLAPGSIKVSAGQWVKRGDVLGLAGSSGRSPSPHLHFQLQGTAELGAPTLPCVFAGVVIAADHGASMPVSHVPSEGERVRDAVADEDVASYLAFDHGATWSFRTDGRRERVRCDADLSSRAIVRSLDREASLYYAKTDDRYVSLDAVGDGASVVHLLRAALPRVPFDSTPSLVWRDVIPGRRLRSRPLRALYDFIAPFAASDAAAMELTMRREGALLIIEGTSIARDRRGAPIARTEVTLMRGRGPLRVTLRARGATVVAERDD